MKKTLMKNLLILATALAILPLSSCIDDSIDLDNISDEMTIGGTLSAPLGTANLNIEKLLSNYEPDENSDISIGTQDSIITLFYQDSMSYANPTDLSLDSSLCVQQLITGDDFSPAITGTTLISGNDSYTCSKKFKITKVDDDDEADIDSIYFYYSLIKVTVGTDISFPGSSYMEVKINLPDASTNSFNKTITVRHDAVMPYEQNVTNFYIATTDSFTSEIPIDIIFYPMGETISIDETNTIDITFEPLDKDNSQYVAFGDFNYTDTYQQEEKIFEGLDLYSYLPTGNFIKPVDPEIKLSITSNVGLPLNLYVDDLQSQIVENNIITDSAEAAFSTGNEFDIYRAELNEDIASSEIVFDQTNGLDNIFTIKFNDAKLDISFKQDLSQKPATNKEFIKSDSKIDMIADISIPIWLEIGSILAYSDTLENVNLNDILEDDNINELVLKFTNTNSLPFGFDINIELLDENSNLIPTTNNYSYHVDAATVDNTGKVLSEVVSNFNIKYENGVNDEFKYTKHIKLNITTNELTNKVKVQNSNSLQIKLGAYTSGGISISSNSND